MDNDKKNFWFNIGNGLMTLVAYVIIIGVVVIIMTGCASSKSQAEDNFTTKVESSVKPLVINTEEEHEGEVNITAINMYGDETFKYEGTAHFSRDGEVTNIYIDMRK